MVVVVPVGDVAMGVVAVVVVAAPASAARRVRVRGPAPAPAPVSPSCLGKNWGPGAAAEMGGEKPKQGKWPQWPWSRALGVDAQWSRVGCAGGAEADEVRVRAAELGVLAFVVTQARGGHVR